MSSEISRSGSGRTRLDNYVDRYAARTAGMTASEIRALFSVASRPEVVSLAGGMPNISGLPLDVVGRSLHDLVSRNGPVAMQYSSGQGDPGLREQICDVMALEGIDGHPDDVVVTIGSQQAVDLVTRIFCDPGDVVLCEAPSYVGALGVFRAYQCDVVHVEMDRDGLVPAALREAIATCRAQGRRIKFLYTIPNYHNPAGVTLTAARRAEILDICREADVLVLEDNPYGLLGFDSDPIPSIRADEADGVIYLGTFSKTFAPGFRVGWALAPHAVREKLVLAQESATLCPPTFSQLAVSAYLSDHDWLGQVKEFQEMYRERRDAIQRFIDHFLNHYRVRFNRPNLDVSAEARERLKNYSWPGNVRELRNCLERAAALSQSELALKRRLPSTQVNLAMSQARWLALAADPPFPQV